ncbi:uncharacterized protein BYT42DRAFT_610 [Radiomyces spectabilis]|uniref:uncharacterized protein n=1 Tax=Radiomyces spectabilis TaxID=64574 RepID=UPI00221FA02B|nr:uncharacterized protein BYT42DRAFT_610 [Radiomyces spectabilis]KAI8393274.1 hypothetical protein BYT42DRAFT_610 [Radiomyces spectabilis]
MTFPDKLEMVGRWVGRQIPLMSSTVQALTPVKVDIAHANTHEVSLSIHHPNRDTLCPPTHRLKHMRSHPAMRSMPSIQVSSFNVHAYPIATTQLPGPTQTNPVHAAKTQQVELSRTQHKLMLQRQSFLADDKNHLNHPANMRRLTKELDRVNREYQCVRHFEDPMVESLKRVSATQRQHGMAPSLSNPSSVASSWSSTSSTLSSHTPAPRLERRSSASTVREILMRADDHQYRRSVLQKKSQTAAVPQPVPPLLSRLFHPPPLPHPKRKSPGAHEVLSFE